MIVSDLRGARPSLGVRRSLLHLGRSLFISVVLCSSSFAADPFADGVAVYTPGTNGGFGSELLPDIVLGPPRGTGQLQGSFDVVALGIGGSITLRFDLPVICDGAGADFTVFENAFHSGSISGPIFTEFGYVAVSQDGIHFVDLPYDADSKDGLAGRTPVDSHPDNGIDPLDPSVSGGDAFDLAQVGLAWAAYVRLTDVADEIMDFGDLPQFRVAPNAGFELDAVAALHACEPDLVSTPTPSGTPTPTVAATATETRTLRPTSDRLTPTSTSSRTPARATATASPVVPLPGDLDGDGSITAADSTWLAAEIYDGDGDATAAVGGGHVASSAAADANDDGRVTAADFLAPAVAR